MEYINSYFEENKERFLEELLGLIRINTTNPKTDNKPDMYKAAAYWKEILLQSGFDKVDIYEAESNPITYGEKMIDPSLPTFMIYSHMDVMPPFSMEQWSFYPFDPNIRNGKIYGCGVQSKVQGIMHAKAFELIVKENSLPCNVKYVIDGEHIIGSTNFITWCRKNKEILKADVILVSDFPSFNTNQIGLENWQIIISELINRDFHAGNPYIIDMVNPIKVLCSIVENLMNNKVGNYIAGFYDDVIEISDIESELTRSKQFDKEGYIKDINVELMAGERGYTSTGYTDNLPFFDIHGIGGGYTGEGVKIINPSKAIAKISCRLIPNQDPHKIADLLREHFEDIAHKSVKVEVIPLRSGRYYCNPISISAYKAAKKTCKVVKHNHLNQVYCGGSIPVISTLEEILKINSVLIRFGTESNFIHSPEDYYPLEQFYNGIETLQLFYRYFAEISK